MGWALNLLSEIKLETGIGKLKIFTWYQSFVEKSREELLAMIFRLQRGVFFLFSEQFFGLTFLVRWIQG